jgi:hypothetical protein
VLYATTDSKFAKRISYLTIEARKPLTVSFMAPFCSVLRPSDGGARTSGMCCGHSTAHGWLPEHPAGCYSGSLGFIQTLSPIF